MSMTDPTAPPETIGTQPRNASEVNNLVGLHLREFMTSKGRINQDREYLAATDLKVAPYYFTPEQETDIKTAVLQLDQALDAIDMTFISRIVGMF